MRETSLARAKWLYSGMEVVTKAELFLRLYSPVATRVLSTVGRIPSPLVSIQVRGKKQKFGGATRDPFKSLQRKLARQQQMKHAKVPLMSEERAQSTRLAPITITSIGEGLPGYECCRMSPCDPAGQLVATYTPLEKFAKAPLYTRLVGQGGVPQMAGIFVCRRK